MLDIRRMLIESGIHPHPGPPQASLARPKATTAKTNLTIECLNVTNLEAHLCELLDREADVTLLQATGALGPSAQGRTARDGRQDRWQVP